MMFDEKKLRKMNLNPEKCLLEDDENNKELLMVNFYKIYFWPLKPLIYILHILMYWE